jgi:hypothetical protein
MIKLPWVSSRYGRGGAFAAAPAAPAVASGYDLDSSYNITVTPLAHWDASDMNGNGDSSNGWSTGDTVSGTGLWKDRTGNYSLKQASATYQLDFNEGGLKGGTMPSVDIPAYSAWAQGKADVYNADGSSTATLTADTKSWNVYNAGHVWGNGFVGQCLWTESMGTGFQINYDPASNANKIQFKDQDAGNATLFTSSRAFKAYDHWFEVRNYDNSDELGCRAHVDGTAVQNFTSADVPSSLDIRLLGATWAVCAAARIGETLVFNEALGDADRAVIEDYLDNKYDITDS